MQKEYNLIVDPVPKPRMTVRDKWKKRPVVNHYYAFKDLLTIEAKKQNLIEIPGKIDALVFCIAMPDSWSEIKKKRMDGSPHQQRLDLDNLIKSVQDILCKEDKHIWYIGSMKKIWSRFGRIIITLSE